MLKYSQLAQDTIKNIALQLNSSRDILNFCSASTANNEMCRDNYFWYLVFKNKFPQWPEPGDNNYRELFLYLSSNRKINVGEDQEYFIYPTMTISQLYHLVNNYLRDIINTSNYLIVLRDDTNYYMEKNGNRIQIKLKDKEFVLNLPPNTMLGQIFIPQLHSLDRLDLYKVINYIT